MSESHWQEIYDCTASGNKERAADLIFETFDDLFLDSNFEHADFLLQTVDLDLLNRLSIICLLSATLPAKDFLPSRPALFDRIQVVLETRLSSMLDKLK